MTRKNVILCIIILIFEGLLITSALGFQVNSEFNSSRHQLIIKEIDVEPKYLRTNTETFDISKFIVSNSNHTNYLYQGLHPALGRTKDGTLLSAYYDVDFENIIWTFSTDDGLSFNPGLFWEGGGDYPSIKLWNGETFFGTFVTDYNDENGGVTYLFDTTNPEDLDTYRLRFWDWSSYGWYDMIDADIACDSSKNTFEWGISCYIMSSTYGNGYTNGPTLIYSDEEDEGSGWISWYYFDGCKHCDIDIDPITHMGYAVYDWKDPTDGIWKILIWKIEFSDIENGYDEIFTISGNGNLTKPVVAAYNDQILILAETDEFNNQDIICFHTNNGNPTNLSTSFAVKSSQDEFTPDIRCDVNGNFIATYVELNNLYALKSEDNGSSWNNIFGTPINDNFNAVIEEYKTSDLCEYGIKVMWGEVIDIPEIWIGEITSQSNYPPDKPTITGPTHLWKKLTKEFTVTTTDPDGDNIYFFVDWGDRTNSSWLGPYESGDKVIFSHTWDKKGVYTIRAKAKDILEAESEWSELKVSIPRNNVLFKSFIFKLFEPFPILQRILLLIT